MDVYQILMQDHRTVEQIFIDIEQTDDREAERREQLFGKLRLALEAHTVVEENLFYPEIEKYPATKELVAEAFRAHAFQRPDPERVAGVVGVIRRDIRDMDQSLRLRCLTKRCQRARSKRILEQKRHRLGIGIAHRCRGKGPGIVEP